MVVVVVGLMISMRLLVRHASPLTGKHEHRLLVATRAGCYCLPGFAEGVAIIESISSSNVCGLFA